MTGQPSQKIAAPARANARQAPVTGRMADSRYARRLRTSRAIQWRKVPPSSMIASRLEERDALSGIVATRKNTSTSPTNAGECQKLRYSRPLRRE